MVGHFILVILILILHLLCLSCLWANFALACKLLPNSDMQEQAELCFGGDEIGEKTQEKFV